MPIEATTPVVQAAIQEAVYPYLGFPDIRIDWNNPNAEPAIYVTEKHFRVVDGVREWAPAAERRFTIRNLDSEALAQAQAGKPELAQVATALLSILGQVANGELTLLAQPAQE